MTFAGPPVLDYTYETLKLGDLMDVPMPPPGYDATVIVKAQGFSVGWAAAGLVVLGTEVAAGIALIRRQRILGKKASCR